MPANHDVHPNIYDHEATIYELQRVGSAPIAVPVTVNGTKVELPVIRARGKHMGDNAEFDFLDDERNPFGLRFQFAPFGSAAPDTVSQTVKIAHRCPRPATTHPRRERPGEGPLRKRPRRRVRHLFRFQQQSDSRGVGHDTGGNGRGAAAASGLEARDRRTH